MAMKVRPMQSTPQHLSGDASSQVQKPPTRIIRNIRGNSRGSSKMQAHCRRRCRKLQLQAAAASCEVRLQPLPAAKLATGGCGRPPSCSRATSRRLASCGWHLPRWLTRAAVSASLASADAPHATPCGNSEGDDYAAAAAAKAARCGSTSGQRLLLIPPADATSSHESRQGPSVSAPRPAALWQWHCTVLQIQSPTSVAAARAAGCGSAGVVSNTLQALPEAAVLAPGIAAGSSGCRQQQRFCGSGTNEPLIALLLRLRLQKCTAAAEPAAAERSRCLQENGLPAEVFAAVRLADP